MTDIFKLIEQAERTKCEIYLTAEEVIEARLLPFHSVRALSDARRKGTVGVRFVKTGKSVRFPLSEIRNYKAAKFRNTGESCSR
jgi:hypothetical protein